ncbi:hypothetical protein GYMLUDRAFT_252722 [Collybiopsis luxurians FD-317 M1]|uniref:Uncharacterized protein n=1 Tax=Collybiopsis luxurians FD-317 M1 TaxID=944289 RepID=A0A0D0AKI4_9AGAR|nr:hypothetical protein GYMLUDRAFT_252722 [Collybiopsis luxurians FD-317 M1]
MPFPDEEQYYTDQGIIKYLAKASVMSCKLSNIALFAVQWLRVYQPQPKQLDTEFVREWLDYYRIDFVTSIEAKGLPLGDNENHLNVNGETIQGARLSHNGQFYLWAREMANIPPLSLHYTGDPLPDTDVEMAPVTAE